MTCRKCFRRRWLPLAAFTSPAATGSRWSCERDPTFELLRKNTLEDGFDASPALVDRQLFLRGHKYLYALAAN